MCYNSNAKSSFRSCLFSYLFKASPGDAAPGECGHQSLVSGEALAGRAQGFGGLGDVGFRVLVKGACL